MKNKTMINVIVSVLLLSFNVMVNAKDVNGLTCLGKQNSLNKQIEYAKKIKNQSQLKGLEKALDEVTAFCNNDNLKEKYQEKVKAKLENLHEKQESLHQARLKSDAEKIAQQEKKVTKAQKELKQAQQQLNSFYQALESERR